MYNGDVVLEFDERRHQYRVRVGGRRYKVPSVTGICGIISKPALIPWAVNSTIELIREAIGPGAEYSETYLEEVFRSAKGQARGLKSEAGSRGTALHHAIERFFVCGELPEVDSPERFGVDAISAYAERESLKILAVERRLYSRRHRYSGTCDCIAEVDGKLALLDWKTSKGIYPEFRLQTAAYVKAYEEETGKRIEERIILRVGAVVEPHRYARITLRKDFAAFLGAKSLFEQIQAIEKESKKAPKVEV